MGSTFDGNVNMLSYNVLSQEHLERNTFLYEKVPLKYQSWEYRSRMLREQFFNWAKVDNIDIFSLQEVDEKLVSSFYKPFFKDLGYEFIYYKRQSSACPDGCAIAFNSSKYRLISKRNLNYYCDPESKKQSWNTVGHSVSDQTRRTYNLKYPNVAVIAKLALKEEKGKEVLLASTHLLFNKLRGEVKLAQLALLFSEMYSLSNGGHIPVIMTGDLNCTDVSSIIQNYVLNGHFNYIDQKSAAISGQMMNPGARKLPTPPLPEFYGVDYRTSTYYSDKHISKQIDNISLRLKEGTEWYDPVKDANKKFGSITGSLHDRASREEALWADIESKDAFMGREKSKKFVDAFTKAHDDWREGASNVFSQYDKKEQRTQDQYDRRDALKKEQKHFNPWSGKIEGFVGHLFKIYSPYLLRSNGFKNPGHTMILDDRPVTVDHILLTDNVATKNVLDTPSPVPEKQVLSADHPSDHYPVGAILQI